MRSVLLYLIPNTSPHSSLKYLCLCTSCFTVIILGSHNAFLPVIDDYLSEPIAFIHLCVGMEDWHGVLTYLFDKVSLCSTYY